MCSYRRTNSTRCAPSSDLARNRGSHRGGLRAVRPYLFGPLYLTDHMSTVAPTRIGTLLRRARVASGVSIPEAAWRMRTRPAVLRALEREDFGDVGHRSDARTYLLSYARLLGMDAAEVAEAFDDMMGGTPGAIVELDARVSGSRKPPRARWILAASICAAIIALAALGGVLGGQAERTAKDTETSPAFKGSSAAVPATEALVRVELVVSEKTQISIHADGVEVFDGEMSKGPARTFRARSALEIIAADGGVVRVTLNGRSLGALGDRGAIARVRLGPNGRIDA